MNHCDQPFMVEHRLSSNLVYYDGLPPELTASERYSYRGRAILKPKTTGLHEFSLFLSELEREEVQDSGRIGFMENPGVLDKFFQDDIDMARGSDIAIIIVGKDHEWETETSDMVSMDLPGRSNEFISAVAVPRSTGFS
ncbi:Beta-glucosidase [Fusarium oxysporum f. sp. rapae]|uniref:Beta-glucosidase n=1 Tax=Fusarium oxysporum f. sp. rapae TaxID=485398 RepID=A0A8J5TQF5_FUSOX|nr:Beta-glucosidase [Fusarium oxysporum f. sp. rapae]